MQLEEWCTELKTHQSELRVAEWLVMLRKKACMKMQAIILMEDKALAMAVREGTIDNAVHHSANLGSIGRG
ncbi:hypothetical protein WJX82_006555 [Trebouxia sp. C0006]